MRAYVVVACTFSLMSELSTAQHTISFHKCNSFQHISAVLQAGFERVCHANGLQGEAASNKSLPDG